MDMVHALGVAQQQQKGYSHMAGPRLQHASMLIPPGTQDAVRAFYGEVLGLEEKQPPRSLAHLHLVWFAAGEGELELHFLPDPTGPDETDQRHICLVVEDLEAYRRRLTEAGVTILPAQPLLHPTRCFSRDPFGNRLEFTSIQRDYREVF